MFPFPADPFEVGGEGGRACSRNTCYWELGEILISHNPETELLFHFLPVLCTYCLEGPSLAICCHRELGRSL